MRGRWLRGFWTSSKLLMARLCVPLVRVPPWFATSTPIFFAIIPEELARAAKIAQRVYEVTEFIVDVLGIDDLDD